jgi:hypothetical protein
MPRRIYRRDALKLAFAGGVATMLQACGSGPSHGDASGRVPRFEAAGATRTEAPGQTTEPVIQLSQTALT